MGERATGDELQQLRDQVAALRRDLEASRGREQALAESEARFRALTEESIAGVYVLQDGKFAYMNEPGARMFGAAREQLIGQAFETLVTPESVPVVAENIRRRLTREVQSLQYGVQVRTLQGEIREIEVLGSAVTWGGRPAILGTAVDRTEAMRAERQLHAQTQLLQRILDSMGDGVAATNSNGEFIVFNPAARRITGLGPLGSTPDEWRGHYGIFQSDMVTPFDPEQIPLARAQRGESSDAVELFLRNPQTPDGAWIRVSGRPLLDEHGADHGGVVVFHDTTLRRRMYEQLERAEAKYRALVEQLPVVSYTATAPPVGTLFYVSPQIEPLLGFTPGEWTADTGLWLRQAHPEDRERVLNQVTRCWETGERLVCEYRLLARNGDIVWLRDEAVIIQDGDGKPVLMQGVLIDITEREQERSGRKRLQALSMDLVAVQEAERRRLGLELHDDIGQVLAGLKIMLGAAATLPLDGARRKLLELELLVDDATQRVRLLSQSLRPAVLDDLGLLPALVSHLGSYRKTTGIQVEFEHHGIECRRFGPDLETAAYRIVQEALTNVARHAGVHSAHVRIWSDDSLLCLYIEDQGAGFDAEGLPNRSAVRGIGGMRERAGLLGGTLTVDSALGQGCRLTVELPVADFTEWR